MGKIIFPNGKVKEGEWKDGARTKWLGGSHKKGANENNESNNVADSVKVN